MEASEFSVSFPARTKMQGAEANARRMSGRWDRTSMGHFFSTPVGITAAIADAKYAPHGVLDWYLVALKETEHGDIEGRNMELKAALTRLIETAGGAHRAVINDQHDEDHDISDAEWPRSRRAAPPRKLRQPSVWAMSRGRIGACARRSNVGSRRCAPDRQGRSPDRHTLIRMGKASRLA